MMIPTERVLNSSVIFVCASGGAGEGKQHLTPSGTMKNVHQVKSDESLPFYCHPPNPCPKGYTSEFRLPDQLLSRYPTKIVLPRFGIV